MCIQAWLYLHICTKIRLCALVYLYVKHQRTIFLPKPLAYLYVSKSEISEDNVEFYGSVAVSITSDPDSATANEVT